MAYGDGMLRHVALFKWNDDVTQAHVDATAAALSTLPDLVGTIVAFRHGRDLGLVEGNFDYAVAADFDDIDGYHTYRTHPDHVAVLGTYVIGHVSARAAAQFTIT